MPAGLTCLTVCNRCLVKQHKQSSATTSGTHRSGAAEDAESSNVKTSHGELGSFNLHRCCACRFTYYQSLRRDMQPRRQCNGGMATLITSWREAGSQTYEADGRSRCVQSLPQSTPVTL